MHLSLFLRPARQRFDTLYEEGTWQVAAVLRTELGADALPYYSFFDASTQEEWQQRVDAILELSLYEQLGPQPKLVAAASQPKFCPSCSPRVCWPFAALLGC